MYIFLYRKNIYKGIIGSAKTMIDFQSSTNKSFITRTSPGAAMNQAKAAEDSQLYQMTKK